MLVRLWHGATLVSKAVEYLHLMRTVAIPDYQKIPGNIQAYVLHNIAGDLAHFQMLIFWKDLESIKAFAGEDFVTAKYYDFDQDFLVELEPTATVYTAYDK